MPRGLHAAVVVGAQLLALAGSPASAQPEARWTESVTPQQEQELQAALVSVE